MVKLLLDKGMGNNFGPDPKDLTTPAYMAVRYGDLDMVHLLCRNNETIGIWMEKCKPSRPPSVRSSTLSGEEDWEEEDDVDEARLKRLDDPDTSFRGR